MSYNSGIDAGSFKFNASSQSALINLQKTSLLNDFGKAQVSPPILYAFFHSSGAINQFSLV
jgi:hypothetical protein